MIGAIQTDIVIIKNDIKILKSPLRKKSKLGRI
jgi:hypothetical protein